LPAIIAVVCGGNRSVRPREDWRVLPFFVIGVRCGPFYCLARANFIGAQGTAFSIIDLTAVSYRRARLLVYLFKLAWPTKLTFIYHAGTLAHGVVAVSLSGSSDSICSPLPEA